MIFLILLLALILRLVNLGQSLWLDEAVQAITSQKSFAYIFQEIIGDFHPPLYHFLMHDWVRIFGSSEVALRIPSVLFGVGTVWLVYRLGKIGRLGKVWALVAALFLATAPFHVYYSHEARMYSMACFFVAGSMYYFLKINELTNLKIKRLDFITSYSVFYFVFTLLALYTDYYAFLVLAAQVLVALLKRQYRFIVYSSLFIVLYFPWLPMFMVQLKTGMAATRALPEWGRLVNLSFIKALPLTFVKFTLGRITIFDKRLYLGVTLGILGGLGILGTGIIREIRKDRGDWGKAISLWLFLPILMAWLGSLLVPNYQPFRLLLVLPAFYLLLVWGIASFKKRKFQILAVGAVLGVNLISLSVYYLNPYFQREDWRGVVKYIENRNDGIALLPSETSRWPWDYYSEGKVQLITAVAGVDKVELPVSLPPARKVYYLRYLVPLFDSGELILKELKQKGYTMVKEDSFNQIPVWEYRLKD
jgi:uncharacterized membrane protein